MTIQVFRLEHVLDGCGPHRDRWWATSEMKRFRAEHQVGNEDHPGPRMPGEPWHSTLFTSKPRSFEKEVFGCDSLERLNRWFGVWLQPLIELGFVVKVYEVADRHAWIGASGQVSFLKPRDYGIVKNSPPPNERLGQNASAVPSRKV